MTECKACHGTGVYSAACRPGDLTTNSKCQECNGTGEIK